MLSKSKLNSIEVLISNALSDSDVSHDEFVLINMLIENVPKEFYDMKEKIKNYNDKWRFKLYIEQCYLIVWSVEKNRESKNPEVLRTENGRIMLFSKCSGCKSKNSKFLKEQETRGLLSSLGIRTLLDKRISISRREICARNASKTARVYI